MPGLKYVGADYSEDGNSSDVVDKGDVDTEFQNATVTQASVQNAINTAVSTMASSTYVNTALQAFVQPNFLNSTNVYTLAIATTSTTSGTYTLTYGSQTTAAIAWNAPASIIQTTLGALSNLANVVVAGQVGGPYQITLQPIGGSVALSVNANSVSNGTPSISPSNMIPENWVGEFVPPIVSGTIPEQFIPSLGFGYVLGPFGATATFPVIGTGASPAKIADFAIGPTGISNQPMAFMNLLVSGSNGARPVIDVAISSGQQPYASQTLIARGVGRSCWNDLQAITVLPVPSILGHTGLANTGYSPTYNAWISAWLYDANNQSVSLNVNNIVAAGVWFWRYQQ